MNSAGKHLALTGLREFWPADEKVWLVSPMCIPRPPLDDGDALISGVIPYPWTLANLPETHARSRALYESMLEFLTSRLNALHGVDHARSYWNRVVGSWLFHYVNLVYHHYTTLMDAKERLGAVESIGLDEGSYITPRNTLAFLHEATDDPYNLQLYTRLCDALDIPVVERRRLRKPERLSTQKNPEGLPQRNRPVARRATYRLLRELRKWGQRVVGPRAKIVLWRSFLPSKFEWKLVAALRGRAWPHDGAMYEPARSGAVDAGMRRALQGYVSEGDELAQVIGSYLKDDLPRVFVEEYAGLVAFTERTYKYASPRVVLSTAAWDTDEAFCHFAGISDEAGALVVGGECSAIFGIEQDSQILEFERSRVDIYLTWGWSDPHDPNSIPIAANRVIGLRERARPLDGKGILYAGTVALRFPVIARPDFSGYSELQRRFFDTVDPALRSEFRVRLHISDFGWGIERHLKAAFPDLEIDRWQRAFNEALYSAKMYVCDHMSTTWTVALASNTPTVIFWDPLFIPPRPEMQPYFDKARAVGIVHDTPESAAEWVAKVYPDVEDWWFDEKTQRALHEFRDQIARVSEHPLRDWRELLESLLDRHQPKAGGHRVG